MKLFGKRKNKPATNIARKAIDAMNYTPENFVHTNEFYKRLYKDRPLIDARKEISRIPVSALVDENQVICDVRDPSIDSFVTNEKIEGRKQYIEHFHAILQIFDSINDAVPTAISLKEHIAGDLEKIEADIAKYEALQDAANK